MKLKLSVLVIIATACLTGATTARAAYAGQVCAGFKSRGVALRSLTVGAWTCSAAKTWILKLSLDPIHSGGDTAIALKNGPRGYHCWAYTYTGDSRATAGACYTGTKAYPRSGFSWLKGSR